MVYILWNVIRPVLLSALSIFVTFHVLQPCALWLDPSFNLLASRGVGKVAFVTLVIIHIFLLLIMSAQSLWQKFLSSCIYFFWKERWLKQFFVFFTIFFALHTAILGGIVFGELATFESAALTLNAGKIFGLTFGFFVTFLLAWSEELIFRGTLYQYFAQFISPFTSAVITSLIFSLVHDLTSPWNLVAKDWKLGLGLFLLGLLLNLIFIVTGKLYTGMGVHAGLVYVKVILRRLPLIVYAPTIPFWLDIDLRQSLLVHLLFVIVILGICICYRKRIWPKIYFEKK